ncbi:uncharacterized protein LOC110909507 [Helianthus annuus]|uniref:uncharacterized protein LOC110909507 n=1 Tax=Helianthus annuus TaxID=4232 RepID=UPI0016532AD6|nr:uncharacterized protein LOC110909507 [Helianthus annuus]
MIQNSNGSISTLPNCLHSLVGTTRTIQVDTSTYYHHGAFESFNCKRVLPDETDCQSVGSTTPTPMTRKGKGVMTIPTPVKLKETIRKYIPTYEGSDSDGSVGSAPGESPTYEGSYSEPGSGPGERPETLKRLVNKLKKPPQEVFDSLKNQTVDLVFTAHLTQAIRRSLLQKHGRQETTKGKGDYMGMH